MVQCTHHCAARSHAVVTGGLAYEARKAPGGSYQHNIFHQFESLSCMLQMALTHTNGEPDTLLWPYQTLPWSRALAHAVIPQARWVETCCGPTNVRAAWFQGRRELCGCFQTVCPLRYTHFWPGANGSAAHRAIRQAVWQRCGIRDVQPVAVRLLEREISDGRQLESRPAVVTALRHATAAQHLGQFEEKRMVLAARVNGSAAHVPGDVLLPTLCEQAAWFANARVIVLAHGAATTNAIFASPGTLIIDIVPYAYRHEPAAPSEYYEALLAGTDVGYRMLASVLPQTPLGGVRGRTRTKATPPSQISKSLAGKSEVACRDDKSCRLAYRDHCCMRLDDAQQATLQKIIRDHLQGGG